MKKTMVFIASVLLLFGVSCGAPASSTSIGNPQEIDASIEVLGDGEKITFGDATLVVPTNNWVKYSEELEEGIVSYLYNGNEDVELGVLFMTLDGIGIEGITGEQAIDTLKKEIKADEAIEIVSLEDRKVQGHSAVLICYNEIVSGDSLEDAEEEKNQTNIYLVSTDTGIIMVALVAPETTEPYLADFTSIVNSVSFA